MPIFLAFLNTHYDHSVIADVRLKLILLWRFWGLFRSVDLSRVRRDLSSVDERQFVAVKRKNQRHYRFEEVLVLKDDSFSPWHILQLYVTLTAHQVPPGGPSLITLKRPFTALTFNTTRSLTRGALAKLGLKALEAHILPELLLWNFLDNPRRRAKSLPLQPLGNGKTWSPFPSII